MKKIFTILFLVISTSIFSQSLFDKYEDMDNVTSILINSKMFKMLGDMNIDSGDSEADVLINQFKSLNSLTVYSTNDNEVSRSISDDVDSYVELKNLEELMRIKEGNQNIKFYVKSGSKEYMVDELLMFVTGNNNSVGGRSYDTVLLSLLGNIDLRTISNLTQKLDVPRVIYINCSGMSGAQHSKLGTMHIFLTIVIIRQKATSAIQINQARILLIIFP